MAPARRHSVAMMKKLDLAIIGGGPAGLTLALCLQRAQTTLRFAVFERASYPRFKICAGGLAGNVRGLLGRLELDLPRPHVTLRGSRIVREHREVDFDEPHIGWVIRRDVLDQGLAEAAQRRGVELRQGAGVVDLQRHRQGYVLRTATEQVHARAVAICTGTSNQFHRLLDPDRRVKRTKLIMLEGPRAASDPDDRIVFDLTELGRGLQGYVWHFPYVDRKGRAGTNRGAMRARMSEPALRDAPPERPLSTLIDEHARAAGVDPGACKRYRYSERPLSAQVRLTLPGVIFVGESAGIDPFLGAGISQAMRMAELASQSVIRAFRRSRDGLPLFSDYWARLVSSPLGRELALQRVAARLAYGPSHQRTAALAFDHPEALRPYIRLFAGQSWQPRTWKAVARAAPRLGVIAMRDAVQILQDEAMRSTTRT